jgi:twitching motility protein PilT
VAVLDRYLEALRTPGAQAITFRSGAPVELLVNGASRVVSKGVPTFEQLRSLLEEVLPPGYRFEPDAKVREFPYEGPMGRTRLTVRVAESAIALRVTPWAAQAAAAAPAQEFVIEHTRHPGTPDARARKGDSGAPAAEPSSVPAVLAAQKIAAHQSSPGMPAAKPAPHASYPAMNAVKPDTVPPANAHAPAHAAAGKMAVHPSVGGLHGKPSHIDELFHQMLDLEASDLHLKSNQVPMMRLHGDMAAMGRPALSNDELWALLEPILPPRNREQFEQTRDTDFSYALGTRARMRCNVFKDIAGVGAVFRQIPASVIAAKDLGLPACVLRLCEAPKGLVLVTGPTGSGKSTTLASMIDHINDTRTDHIITIEDPVEFVHPDKKCLVNQREIGASTMSFSAALRAALREDPDVVLVGEMRDLETTAIAIETAETGHLVFGTLHTNTAASTIDRLINQYPADRQQQIRAMLSESLLGVVSQTLCRKKGGGRVAAYEILLVTPAVSNLIREEKTFQIPSVMQTSRGMGMQTMNDALFALVKNGLITPEEGYANSIAKKEMALSLTRANIRGPWSEEGVQP